MARMFERIGIMALLAAGAMVASRAAADEPVSFTRDIGPILLTQCQTCHGEKESKGKYRVDTFERFMTSRSKGPVLISPGKPADSELFTLVTIDDAEQRMPQDADALPAAQIELFRRWIEQGAKFDGPSPDAPLSRYVRTEDDQPAPQVYPRAAPVTALAFSPDGEELAVSGYREVTVWRPTDGTLLRRIGPMARRVFGVAYSPDGSLLAVAAGVPGERGEVTLYERDDGERLAVLGTLEDAALDVAFSPDGRLLAAGGADNAVRLYDVAMLSEVARLDLHADWVTAVAFDAEGKRLATASRDRSARVIEVESLRVLTTCQLHDGPLLAVTFLPGGAAVATAGLDRTIHLWKPADAGKIEQIKGVGPVVHDLLATDKALWAAGADRLVRQYTLDGKQFVGKLEGHGDWVYRLSYDAKHNRLAGGGYDGEVRLWNLEDGHLIGAFIASPGRTAHEPTP